MDPDGQRHFDVGRAGRAGDQDDSRLRRKPTEAVVQQPGLERIIDFGFVEHRQVDRRKQAGQLRSAQPRRENESPGVGQSGDRPRQPHRHGRIARQSLPVSLTRECGREETDSVPF